MYIPPPLYFAAVSWLESKQLPCLLTRVIGYDCPGCGIQRSAISLLRGDVGMAFHYYPALPVMLLFFAYLVFKPKNGSRFSTKITQGGIVFIFLIILASYITKLTN